MFINALSSAARAALRTLPAFSLAAGLLGSSLGAAVPAFADDPIVRDHRDPSARLQLEIKRVIVHDDMDWGNGEVNIRYQVRTQIGTCAPDEQWTCGPIVVEGKVPQFTATDGWVQTINRIVPAQGDTLLDSSVGPGIGIPIRPGAWYGLKIVGTESDTFSDDRMGEVRMNIIAEDGHIREGTFTQRSDSSCNKYPLESSFCTPPSSGEVTGGDGAFSVEFTIRHEPLPDLRPVNIKVLDLPGNAKKSVCMAVQNIELGFPGPFELALQIDGVVPPGGRATAGNMTPGTSGELCVEVALPTSGQHQLAVVADEPNTVLEYNETNNVYQQAYAAPPRLVPSTEPGGSPAVDQADLAVSAIRINGQTPDGKNDCEAGKNDVAVLIKNGGGTSAGSFAVQLAVDGSDVATESAAKLDAGAEREIRFDDIRLREGVRTLSAKVIGDQLDESNEDNNTRKATAKCKGDD
jgi:hypothetical protein